MSPGRFHANSRSRLTVAVKPATSPGGNGIGREPCNQLCLALGGLGRAMAKRACTGKAGEEKIDQLGHYVMSLSGQSADAAKADAGKAIFQGKEGGCHYCHTACGKGLFSQGAANLTDAVWTVADVPGAADDTARLEAVKSVISEGVQREMPAWKERLDDAQIKLLTVYVQSLGS